MNCWGKIKEGFGQYFYIRAARSIQILKLPELGTLVLWILRTLIDLYLSIFIRNPAWQLLPGGITKIMRLNVSLLDIKIKRSGLWESNSQHKSSQLRCFYDLLIFIGRSLKIKITPKYILRVRNWYTNYIIIIYLNKYLNYKISK